MVLLSLLRLLFMVAVAYVCYERIWKFMFERLFFKYIHFLLFHTIFFLTHPAKFRPKMTSGRKPAAAGKTPGKPNAFKVSGL